MGAAVSSYCGAPVYTEIALNGAAEVKFVLPEPSTAAFGLIVLPGGAAPPAAASSSSPSAAPSAESKAPEGGDAAAATAAAASPVAAPVHAPVAASNKPANLAKDILISCAVHTGRVQAVYFAAQEEYPARTRKVWTAGGVCWCKNVADCDHAYPKCVSKSTGKPCTACCDADRNYQHLSEFGRALDAAEPLPADAVGAIVAIHIAGQDKDLRGGPNFVSIVSAEAAADAPAGAPAIAVTVGVTASECAPRQEVPVRLGNRGGGGGDAVDLGPA